MNDRGPTLESLESRALLSPTVLNLSVSPSPANAGAVVVATVDASSTVGLRAATFFRDVNANGRWDAGVDQALGDSFNQVSAGRFQKSFQVGAGWANSTRIVANVVDVNGSWATPRSFALSVNHAPVVTAAGVSAASVREGDTLRITAAASDDSAVRLMTAYIDADSNGRWSPGVDRWLADDLSASPQTGEYEFSVRINGSWPASARILVDALDFGGLWSGSPRLAGTVRLQSRPVVTALSSRVGDASPDQPGNPLVLTATATDATGVAAVTFWLDLDENGAWTPGVDQSLGDVRTPAQGTHDYSLQIYTDLAGLDDARIVADAVNTDGMWSGAPRGADASLPRLPSVLQFLVDTSHSGYVLGAEAWIPPAGGLPAAQVPQIEYVADTNFNGVRDAGDVLVASVTPTTTLQVGWRHYYRLSADDIARLPSSYQWLAIPVFNPPGQQNVRGAARVGIAKPFTASEPIVTRVTATVGLDDQGASAPAIAGNFFRASADGFAASGVQGVTFFWDSNLNGRWDAGVDTDLGFVTLNAGLSGHAEISGQITPSMAGPGAINAAVRTVTGSGELWSAPRAIQIDRVAAGPSLSLVGTSLSGGILTIEIDARDDFAVRAISGFIESGNEIQDAVSAVRISGNARAGRWRLTINVAGITPGSVVAIRGVDFYLGQGLHGNTLEVIVPSGAW